MYMKQEGEIWMKHYLKLFRVNFDISHTERFCDNSNYNKQKYYNDSIEYISIQ